MYIFLFQSKERAALCLGQLCVGEEKFPHRKTAIEGLLDSVTVSHLYAYLKCVYILNARINLNTFIIGPPKH